MNIITITKDNFEAEVLESRKPVLIDFWATWWRTVHRMQGPVLDEIAAETDAIKIGKVNVDEEQMLATQVSALPAYQRSCCLKTEKKRTSLWGFARRRN